MFEMKQENQNNNPNASRPTPRPVFDPNPSPARRVAEGAMLVAVAVIFGLSANYLPLVWLIALFLWPVPLALLVRRFGPGFGLLGTALTAVLLSIFIGPLSALFMLLNMGGVGFWYGWAARKELNPWATVITGVFIAAISMVLMLLFSTWLAGLQFDDLLRQVDEFVDFYIATMQNSGQLQQLQGNMTTAEFTVWLKDYLTSMLPSSMIFIAMLEAGISYAVTGYIFRRLGYPLARLPRFKEWRLPWYTLWGLIAALLAFVVYHQTELDWCRALCNNIMYIYQPLMMLAGLAMYYWLAEFWQMPWMIWLLVFMAIGAFSIAGPMLLILGLTDSVWDIRKSLLRRRQQQS